MKRSIAASRSRYRFYGRARTGRVGVEHVQGCRALWNARVCRESPHSWWEDYCHRVQGRTEPRDGTEWIYIFEDMDGWKLFEEGFNVDREAKIDYSIYIS